MMNIHCLEAYNAFFVTGTRQILDSDEIMEHFDWYAKDAIDTLEDELLKLSDNEMEKWWRQSDMGYMFIVKINETTGLSIEMQA